MTQFFSQPSDYFISSPKKDQISTEIIVFSTRIEQLNKNQRYTVLIIINMPNRTKSQNLFFIFSSTK